MLPKPTHSVKKEQVCRLIQKELSVLFLNQIAPLCNNTWISVTAVYMGNDFGVAKVYVSIPLHKESSALIQKINQHTKMIKRLLGQKLSSKMRRIPELQFYKDDSIAQGDHVSTLIDQLHT